MNQDLGNGKNGFGSVGRGILLYKRRNTYFSKMGGKLERQGIEAKFEGDLLVIMNTGLGWRLRNRKDCEHS